MSVAATMKKYGIEQMVRFVYKDPEANLPKLIDWADSFCGRQFAPQRALIIRPSKTPTIPIIATSAT